MIINEVGVALTTLLQHFETGKPISKEELKKFRETERKVWENFQPHSMMELRENAKSEYPRNATRVKRTTRRSPERLKPIDRKPVIDVLFVEEGETCVQDRLL